MLANLVYSNPMRNPTGSPPLLRPDNRNYRPPARATLCRAAQHGCALEHALDPVSQEAAGLTGDDLVVMLAALANPLRMRILAKLAGGRDHVSHLAREIGVSRPLLHLHLTAAALAEAATTLTPPDPEKVPAPKEDS
jgi:hypothetical protein